MNKKITKMGLIVELKSSAISMCNYFHSTHKFFLLLHFFFFELFIDLING